MEYSYKPSRFKLSRIGYYFISVLSLFKAISPGKRAGFIAGLITGKREVHLRKFDMNFRMKTLLDVLTLKEVVLDEEYNKSQIMDVNDKAIVDIGAGFGDFSIMTAKRFPASRIFAFEPDREYFSLLKKNIQNNKIKNIKAINKAVSDLKSIFSLTKLGSIDYLKSDCEGSEFSIFAKSHRGTFLRKINKIVMEYHENEIRSVKTMQNILEESNFNTRIKPRTQVANLGLLSAQKHR